MSSMNKSRCWRCKYILCEPGQTCDKCEHYDTLKKLCKCIINNNDEDGLCEEFILHTRPVRRYIKNVVFKQRKIKVNRIRHIYIIKES